MLMVMQLLFPLMFTQTLLHTDKHALKGIKTPKVTVGSSFGGTPD